MKQKRQPRKSWQQKFAETGDQRWNFDVQPNCPVCGQPIPWSGVSVGYRSTCSSFCARSLVNAKRHQKFLQYLHEKEIAKGKDYNRYCDPLAEPPLCPICGKPTTWSVPGQAWHVHCCRSHHLIHNIRNKSKLFHEQRKQNMLATNTYDRYKDFTAGAPECIVNGCHNLTRWHKGAMSWARCCPECKQTSKYLNGHLYNLKYCLNKTELQYDSSFEYAIIVSLEKLGIQYLHEPERLRYDSTNLKRAYVPDLAILYKNCKFLVEIKPEHHICVDFVKFKAMIAIDFVNRVDNDYTCYAFLVETQVRDSAKLLEYLDELALHHKCKYVQQYYNI